MKKILCFCVALFLCLIVTYAQTYPKVKITTKDGLVVKGSKATIENESVSFYLGETQKTYPLSDVSIIQAREGKAGKWALGCGGGCLALCIITTVADAGATADAGTMILGSVIWTGIFAGVGALIGSASDHYDIVYAKSLSFMNKLELNLTTDQFTRYTPKTNNLTLTYRF